MTGSGTPLTPAQDAEFDAYIAEWQVRLGLTDWLIERRPKARPLRGAMADVSVDVRARQALYRTGPWLTEPTAEDLSKIALHEVLHVLLAEVLHVAAKVEANDPDGLLTGAEHRVIHVLGRLLAP